MCRLQLTIAAVRRRQNYMYSTAICDLKLEHRPKLINRFVKLEAPWTSFNLTTALSAAFYLQLSPANPPPVIDSPAVFSKPQNTTGTGQPQRKLANYGVCSSAHPKFNRVPAGAHCVGLKSPHTDVVGWVSSCVRVWLGHSYTAADFTYFHTCQQGVTNNYQSRVCEYSPWRSLRVEGNDQMISNSKQPGAIDKRCYDTHMPSNQRYDERHAVAWQWSTDDLMSTHRWWHSRDVTSAIPTGSWRSCPGELTIAAVWVSVRSPSGGSITRSQRGRAGQLTVTGQGVRLICGGREWQAGVYMVWFITGSPPANWKIMTEVRGSEVASGHTIRSAVCFLYLLIVFIYKWNHYEEATLLQNSS